MLGAVAVHDGVVPHCVCFDVLSMGWAGRGLHTVLTQGLHFAHSDLRSAPMLLFVRRCRA
jgi:hypothetical protein